MINIPIFLLYTHIVLKTADVITTAYPLLHMGAIEVNPIVNTTMEFYGMWPTLFMIFIFHILLAYVLYIRKSNVTSGALLVPIFITVISNLSWITSCLIS